jgi:phage shock protein PspC (stress-responsive transcriptional regulator)
MDHTSDRPSDEGAAQDADGATRSQPDASSSSTGTRPRRLTRRTDQKVLGGVASGLAAYFDIDPVICRLGFLAFGLLTFPLGILVYLVAWAIIPPDGERQQQTDRARTVWIVLAVLAAFLVGLPLLAATFAWFIGFNGLFPWHGPFGFDAGFGFWRPGIFWALVLIGLGVLLFRRGEPVTSPATARDTDPATGTSVVSTSPPRQRSILGRLAVAASLLVVGVVALLENLAVFHLSTYRLLALLLLVVGIALLAGAWWGTARWLIVVGVLLLAALFATSAVAVVTGPFHGHFHGRFGDQTWRPTSHAQVAEPFELAVGDLMLDLTALPLSTDPTQVTAEIGAGNIKVIVPESVDVIVNTQVRAGNVDIFGHREDGMGLLRTAHVTGAPGAGKLLLDLRAGAGSVTVAKAPAAVGTKGR